MRANLLILAGTTEATTLAQSAAQSGLRGTVSFAGRVERPKRQPLPQRIGGFGGVEGLARYLRTERVSHVVDATHPFAAQMSHNATLACAQENVPLIALTRPPWHEKPGDRWTCVAGIKEAVAELDTRPCRVMLAVGRMHLESFAPNAQHFYLLRLVDPPKAPPPFPEHHVLVSRGPFTDSDDRALMQRYEIDLVVSKNAGGPGAYAKIAAARTLGLPVIMIERPQLAPRKTAHTVGEVMQWLDHTGIDLGV